MVFKGGTSLKLHLIPDDGVIAELRMDYEKMLGAGMVYNNPPSFDDIVFGIREIEHEINTW